MNILSKKNHTVSNDYEAGFTMIELVVVILIFAMVLIVSLNIFDWGNKSYIQQESLVRISNSGRQSMTAIENLVLQSAEVLASHSVNGTGYVSSGSNLVLKIPAIDASGDVIASTWDYAAFYLSSGSLFLQLEPAAGSSRDLILNKKLGDEIYSLIFEYDNASFPLVTMVDVEITGQITKAGRVVKATTGNRIYLRNH